MMALDASRTSPRKTPPEVWARAAPATSSPANNLFGILNCVLSKSPPIAIVCAEDHLKYRLRSCRALVLDWVGLDLRPRFGQAGRENRTKMQSLSLWFDNFDVLGRDRTGAVF